MPATRAFDVDLAVLAGEAERVPLLRLAAIPALPGLAADLLRNVVDEPTPDLTELFDRLDAGLLVEFAQCRRIGFLAVIDAALRHLPDVGPVDVLGAVGAAADENKALAIDDTQAGAGAIWQVFVFWHGGTLGHSVIPGERMSCARLGIHIPTLNLNRELCRRELCRR